jgi:Uma2 family endonuclease
VRDAQTWTHRGGRSTDHRPSQFPPPLSPRGIFGGVFPRECSFVAAGRFENDEPPVGYSPVVPDLAVEILSPNDRAQEILDKVGEYLDAGVRIVWVIDPQERRANGYRSLTNVRTLSPEDDLDGEDVLPGFRCRLADIFQ